MGKRYLIDTSAFSKYLTGRLSETSTLLMSEILPVEFLVSVITRMELKSWLSGDEEMEDTIEQTLKIAVIFDLSEEIILKTIEIRRKVKIKLPDAIIAATAIVNGFTLLSTNDKDFVKVPKLKYQSLN
jgi:predicted nucleic acid-binding protein